MLTCPYFTLYFCRGLAEVSLEGFEINVALTSILYEYFVLKMKENTKNIYFKR